MLRILFIDDEPESVAEAIHSLEENISGLEHCTRNFEDGIDSIGSAPPDVVVLDIWKGNPQTSEANGSHVLDIIWDQQFCPVIIYSADPRIISQDQRYNHPLIRIVTKGSGSDVVILDAVTALQPHVKALKEGAETIRKAFARAMRDVAPDVFANFEDENKRADIIVRAGRRRVAALMDEPLPQESSLASWEQYLCPPISSSPQLGDILRMSNASSNDPACYRVILTPSCDLVSSSDRKPKATQVLVAKCCSMKEGLRRIGLHSNSTKDITKHAVLSQGFFNAIIPFPGLPTKIPTMAANLRKLELIPFDKIGSTESTEFLRIASIDSPFRELIAWAYLQISCRPGLPERDLQSWAEEIIEAVEE